MAHCEQVEAVDETRGTDIGALPDSDNLPALNLPRVPRRTEIAVTVGLDLGVAATLEDRLDEVVAARRRCQRDRHQAEQVVRDCQHEERQLAIEEHSLRMAVRR